MVFVLLLQMQLLLQVYTFGDSIAIRSLLMCHVYFRFSPNRHQVACSKPVRYRGDKSHRNRSLLVYTCDFHREFGRDKNSLEKCDKNRTKNRMCKLKLHFCIIMKGEHRFTESCGITYDRSGQIFFRAHVA